MPIHIVAMPGEPIRVGPAALEANNTANYLFATSTLISAARTRITNGVAIASSCKASGRPQPR